MKIVVALDSFKGSLTAVQACDIVAEAIRSAVPGIEVVTKPMADGGEGTASVLRAAAGGQWLGKKVMGPLPEMEVDAGFVWLPGPENGARMADFGLRMADSKRPAPPIRHPKSEIRNISGAALVEMATASGLPLLTPEQRNPLKTTTYGTGQLIKAAIDYGVGHILLAIGGSATVDGGIGAAMALGWKFLTKDRQEVGFGGGQLARIDKIVPPPHPWNAEVEVLCDVDNPLCGEHGAARVYGPQKGATPEMVELLDAGLAHLARLVQDQLGRDIAGLRGAGAAGGLAAGAVAFLNARLVPGIDAVMSQTRLADAVAGADWVVTGEGSFDEQSLRGKVVSGVLRVARAGGAKVAVCAGQVRLEPGKYRRAGIATAVACMEPGMELDYAIAHSAELLDGAARRFACEVLNEKETGP